MTLCGARDHPKLSYICKQMPSNAHGRKRKGASDKHRWERELVERLQANNKARSAYKQIVSQGCLWENLTGFLYHYLFGFTMVFQEHSRRRDLALNGLEAVAGRLDRAAVAMQKLLDTKWWSTPTFGHFLQECRFDVQAHTITGALVSGKYAPEFALDLPDSLLRYSLNLKHLQKELKKNLSERKVGPSVYLATFATYIEVVTQRPIPTDRDFGPVIAVGEAFQSEYGVKRRVTCCIGYG
jgi:hypothetical protein